MKDLISERLVLLATAQESMKEVKAKMNQWDSSQINLEKSAFDCMNVSDRVHKLSNDGHMLIENLIACYKDTDINSGTDSNKMLSTILEALHGIFHKIAEETTTMCEVSHQIEEEAASQKEIEDYLKKSLSQISDSLDGAVACAEFVLAEAK